MCTLELYWEPLNICSHGAEERPPVASSTAIWTWGYNVAKLFSLCDWVRTLVLAKWPWMILSIPKYNHKHPLDKSRQQREIQHGLKRSQGYHAGRDWMRQLRKVRKSWIWKSKRQISGGAASANMLISARWNWLWALSLHSYEEIIFFALRNRGLGKLLQQLGNLIQSSLFADIWGTLGRQYDNRQGSRWGKRMIFLFPGTSWPFVWTWEIHEFMETNADWDWWNSAIGCVYAHILQQLFSPF